MSHCSSTSALDQPGFNSAKRFASRACPALGLGGATRVDSDEGAVRGRQRAAFAQSRLIFNSKPLAGAGRRSGRRPTAQRCCLIHDDDVCFPTAIKIDGPLGNTEADGEKSGRGAPIIARMKRTIHHHGSDPQPERKTMSLNDLLNRMHHGSALVWPAVILLAGAPAAAQPDDAGPAAIDPTLGDDPDSELDRTHDATAASDTELEFQLRTRGVVRYFFETGIDGRGNDDVSSVRAGFDLGITRPLFEDGRFTLSLGYQYRHYDFSGRNAFLAGTNDPFSDIHAVTLGGAFFGPIDEQWSWGAGVRGRFAGEADVDVDDADSIGGFGFARYQATPDFAVALGLAGRTQIEDDASFFPIVGLEWRIDETWRLDAGRPARRFYPGARLAATINDETELGFGVEYQSLRFRLDDDSTGQGAVIEDTGIPVFVDLTYTPDPSFALAIEAGALVHQEFEIENKRGRKERDFETDPTPFVGVSLTWRF